MANEKTKLTVALDDSDDDSDLFGGGSDDDEELKPKKAAMLEEIQEKEKNASVQNEAPIEAPKMADEKATEGSSPAEIEDDEDLFGGSDDEELKPKSMTSEVPPTASVSASASAGDSVSAPVPALAAAPLPAAPAPAPAPSVPAAEVPPAPAPPTKAPKMLEEEKAEPEEEEETKTSLFCSMCWGEDTEDKLLLQCKQCKVVYHNECYRGVSMDCGELEGLQFQQNENGLFEDLCIACSSVGKTVKGRTKGGKHHEITVKSRPYECCLCSVDDPALPLPMHPIYDRNNGRQMILERWKGAPPEIPQQRLGWCHTLCALFISTYQHTGGCVYSCNIDGTYGGVADDDGDEDRSIGSTVAEARTLSRTEKPPDGADPIQTLSLYGHHHFCIVMDKKNWPDYVKAIQRAQKFQCGVCGSVDNKNHIYRMAIACMCRETQEPKNHKACHKRSDVECLIPAHVGCAMWGKRINGRQKFPPLRRVYYQHVEGENDDLCVLYCNQHAKDIRDKGAKHGVEGHDWLRFPGAKVTISRKGSHVPEDAKVEIENANDTIESEGEDYDDDVGDSDDSESDDEDDIGTIESDDEDGSKSKKEKKKKKKKGKGRSSKDRTNKAGVKRKRAPPKAETARNRLEAKLAKRQKSTTTSAGRLHASVATTSGGSSGQGCGGRKQSASVAAPKHGLPLTLETKSDEDGAADAEEKPEPPPKKKIKKPALKLMGLFNGKGVNWSG